MRRTDRLFDLVQILRDGRLHRAADLAAALGGVSVRTIWRDMATLIASGMPIEGERGVGYVLRAPSTLPPLMVSMAEMEALRAGLRQVAHGADEPLARAARSLAAKIAAVAPALQDPDSEDIFAFTRQASQPAEALIPVLRDAIAAGRLLALTVLDPQDQPRRETVRPQRLVTRDAGRALRVEDGTGQTREIGLERILSVDD